MLAIREWQKRLYFLGYVSILFAVTTVCQADDFPEIYNSPAEAQLQPMPASQAAATMQLPDGFHATVFAAEPDVQNPIGMAWDELGRMWVAENYTYSDRSQRFDLTLKDRVTVLEDTDQDGTADRRTVFTDQVQMLTSVEVGKGGVWLMCPPQVLFIPDANQDLVPDGPAQVVLDGFDVAQDNYHNFANGLRWGPDGWLYGRCGHSCPGNLGVPGTPAEQRIPIDGGMWRYHPDRHVVEVLCHGTTNPWGHDWDANGELFFINTVIGHLWHVMPGAHFQESFGESMNPGVYERLDMIADHYHFDTKGTWQQSRDGKANDFGGGHAHVGMLIYQGWQWPEQYRNKLFTINMHGMRINTERLERFGAGYVGRHEPDFLVSQDPFFRGIDLTTSPNGSVFLIDWSDTGECHEHTGVHRTSGRIFQVRYGQPSPTAQAPQHVWAKPACLAADTELARLWKRYQSNQVTRSELRALLQHEDEHLRVWAVRLLTDFWPLDTVTGPAKHFQYPDDPESIDALIELAQRDSSGLVQLTLASTLQRLPVDRRLELALPLVQRPQFANDRDLPLLVWFGLIPVGQGDPLGLAELTTDCQWPQLTRWITRNVASQIESQPDALDRILQIAATSSADSKEAVVRGMVEAFQGWRRATMPSSWPAFEKELNDNTLAAEVRDLRLLFGDGRAIRQVRSVALDGAAEIPVRQQALQTLIHANPDDLRDVCETLLTVRVLNATAATGLAGFDDPNIADLLVRNYRRFQPQDRPTVIEILVSRQSFANRLLDELGRSNGAISAADLTAGDARQILAWNNAALSRKLADVWGEVRETTTDKRAKMTTLRQQLTADSLANADLSHGRQLFDKTCASCHRLYGNGHSVGPDLTGSQRINLDYLLENIVDPSAVVSKDYRLTRLEMKDGRTVSGLVVARNDKTMRIHTQAQGELAFPAEDIERTEETRVSLMPDGLLDQMSEVDIRDLFGYLMHPVQVE
ncbi:MAG: c-type cytochrome [Planctomycetales bacterium]|nr:c-type cytochrome [Planctomycetales bacterium]